MTLAVHVRGRRYVEDRDTAAVLSGSRDRETAFTERWTMALDGDGRDALAARRRRADVDRWTAPPRHGGQWPRRTCAAAAPGAAAETH